MPTPLKTILDDPADVPQNVWIDDKLVRQFEDPEPYVKHLQPRPPSAYTSQTLVSNYENAFLDLLLKENNSKFAGYKRTQKRKVAKHGNVMNATKQPLTLQNSIRKEEFQVT